MKIQNSVFVQVFRLLPKYLIIPTFLLSFLTASIGMTALFYPYLLQQFISTLENHDVNYQSLHLLLSIFIISISIEFILILLYQKFHYKVGNYLKVKIFERTLLQSKDDLETNGEGFYLQMIEEACYTVLELLSPKTFADILSLVQPVLIIAIFMRTDFVASVIVAVIYVVMIVNFIVNQFVFSGLLNKYYTEHRKVSSFITERIGLVSLYSVFPFFRAKVAREVGSRLNSLAVINQKTDLYLETIFRASVKYISPGLRIFLLFYLGYKVSTDNLSISQFVMLLSYYGLMESSMSSFSSLTELYLRVNQAWDAVFKFLTNIGREKFIATNPGELIYSCKNLTYEIQGNVILSNLSFSIAAGKVYGLVGVSGQGKSTLLAILSGQKTNYLGSVFYNQENIELRSWDIQDDLIMIQQDAPVIQGTLGDNILLGDEKPNNDLLLQVISKLGLEILENRFLGIDGAFVSGGEKRKINLARFLYHLPNKAFFFLDEAFISLDNISRRDMVSIVKQGIMNKSGLVISHDLDIIHFLCDEILFLTKNGEIVQGDWDFLLKNDEFSELIKASNLLSYV